MLALSFREGGVVVLDDRINVTIEKIDRVRRRVLLRTPFNAHYIGFDPEEICHDPDVEVCVTAFKSAGWVTLGFIADRSTRINRQAEVGEDVYCATEVDMGNE